MPRKNENTTDADGLIAPIVGSWSDEKYHLISQYASMFSGGMRYKWPNRVYLDLYAGSGRANIRDTTTFVDTSAILALKTNPPFSKYILCDLDAEKLNALQIRAKQRFPNADISYVVGDARSNYKEIVKAFPIVKPGTGTLTFCVIDPFNANTFSFEIIEQLDQMRMDFLMLIPSRMDIGRNIGYYYEEGNQGLERFLGDPDWRSKWDKFKSRARKNADFVADQFCDNMVRLGYQDCRQYLKSVRLPGNQVLLYHLALFTKHPRGLDFWKKSLRGSDPQTSMLEGM